MIAEAPREKSWHEDSRFEADAEANDSEYTSFEHPVVEPVLKVDSSGYLIKHPYINNALNRLLAKWTFKLCTAGGFKIPRFALADDGFPAMHQVQLLSSFDCLHLATT